ncbi:MAG: preprotein translocase subunit SecY [Phycisphaerales bacterium]
MFTAFANIFRIPDLRNRVLFTLGVLAIYRIGFWVPVVGVDQTALEAAAKTASQDATGFGRLLQFASIFSGGTLGQSTIFGLGIMPYITASIILQLLQAVYPPMQELKKEGMSGQQKIMEWTRYLTVLLCVVQGFIWLRYLMSSNLVQPMFLQGGPNLVIFYVVGIASLMAGSLFLMWLGEQVDKYGIGNGVSIILTAGILARMPNAVMWVVTNFDPKQTAEPGKLGIAGLAILIASFVMITAGAVIMTVATRRIPIQQAKHTRGRKVYGGQKHYLPLRINHSGVMPIIFASSLMIFPSAIFGAWDNATATESGFKAITQFLARETQIGSFPYIVCEIAMIYFFAYFWTTVQMSPDDMAKQLKEHGSFIPGLRPGPRTAEYLETVLGRITYVGAGFLAIIAVIPTLVTQAMGIPFQVSQFLGGTGLLIVVSVGLDLIQRLEANLVMRNYQGFLGAPGDARGPRMRSVRG